MGKKRKAGIGILTIATLAVFGWFLSTRNFDVLQPKGQIAEKQLDILIFASLLSLVVLVPVFALTIFIVWRYRADNHKARYTPDWDGNKFLEFIWWGIPITLIAILSVVSWRSTHELDPSKPIESSQKPITIQVVAMDWKWLFIYPEQQIATVNYIQFPKNTPVNFEITSEGPMNSFWIPSLGSQIYAMSGMSTKLHLEANQEGEYNGVSANISGEGFSGMRFVAKASSQSDFDKWISTVKSAPLALNDTEYTKLSQPSKNVPPSFYSSVNSDMYQSILLKSTLPTGTTTSDKPVLEMQTEHNNMGGHH